MAATPHKTSRIDAETVQYRGYEITRHDRKKGYWDHYQTPGYRNGLSAPTLKAIKQQIDGKLDAAPVVDKAA